MKLDENALIKSCEKNKIMIPKELYSESRGS
jgi:hypothetical protein